MKRRSTGQGGNRRRRPQKRPYLLRGIVHCATGHNPLRMQGRSRKGEPTYYTCGYRTSYGDRAAEAVGHGKWQYVREDSLATLIDSFFATRIFGADRLAHFRRQSASLTGRAARSRRRQAQTPRRSDRRGRAEDRAPARRDRGWRRSGRGRQANPRAQGRARRGAVGTRPDRRLTARQHRCRSRRRPRGPRRPARPRRTTRRRRSRCAACGVRRLPPPGRDRPQRGQVRLKALVSSAFGEAKDLSDLGEAGDLALSNKAIPLRGFEPRFPD